MAPLRGSKIELQIPQMSPRNVSYARSKAPKRQDTISCMLKNREEFPYQNGLDNRFKCLPRVITRMTHIPYDSRTCWLGRATNAGRPLVQ